MEAERAMTEEVLRVLVAKAIYEHDSKDWPSDHTRPAWENLHSHDEWDLGQQDYLGEADAALAALGLDDLDAAVEKGAIALHDQQPGVEWARVATPAYKDAMRAKARLVLQAALTTTPESEA